MKRLFTVLITAGMALCFFGCSAEPAETEGGSRTVTVLAAASLSDVMHELELDYEADHPDTDLVFSFAGSGALQAQIEEGAEADIFISASSSQMNTLNEEGLMDSGSIRDLLLNEVVLIVPSGSDLGLTSFEDVVRDDIYMIGIGEPDSVPAGRYAQQVFTNLGIWDEVQAKANYGSDVRTVLTWIEMGELDCGVVYRTDAMTTDLVTVVCAAPEGSCDPVVYPAGIIAGSACADQAEDFLNFLESPEAASVFESYGFTMAG